MKGNKNEKDASISKVLIAYVSMFLFDGMLIYYSCYQMQDGWLRWGVFILSLLILAAILLYMSTSFIYIKESDFDLKMVKFDNKSK